MKQHRILVLFILLSLGLSQCGKQQNAEEQTETSTTDKQDNEIMGISDEIIANPNDANLYIKRAMAYGDRNMFELAHRDVMRAMSIDSTVSSFHAARGELYFRSSELRDSRLSFEKAIALDPKNLEANLKLGEVNFLLRRYPEAIQAVDAAISINERLPKAYFLKGYIFKELGDTALSISSFQTATEVDPEYFDAYMELGNLYTAKNDSIALEYFSTAITLRPASAEAYYHKAMFLQNRGALQRALSVYRSMVKADPNSFLGYYNMGYLHLVELEEYRIASAYFDTVLTIQPNYIDALFNKGLCFEELGEEALAVAIYKEVLEQDAQYTLAAKGLERLLEK